MQFRDFRHQIEPNEETLSEALEAANYRFQDNLALLQLQQPELVQQLKTFEPEHDTLCVSRDNELNILLSDTLTFAWPPRQFEADYTGIAERLSSTSANITALTLQDSGLNVITALKAHKAPLALIYVDSLLELYASLHAHDWRSVLQGSQLIFQLGETIENVERDLKTLEQHGVDAKPCTVIQPLPHNIDAESAWHLEQALTWGHDCDPTLRLHTHKFKEQTEFSLLNKLITELRNFPLQYSFPWTLVLVGAETPIIQRALSMNNLKRVILVHPRQTFADDTKAAAAEKGVELVTLGGSLNELPNKLAFTLSKLPKNEQLSIRLYQSINNDEMNMTRQLCELELRYLVQPTLGMVRLYKAAVQASQASQHMLTRRSRWPQNESGKVPAIIIGNGPSLKQLIPELKKKSSEGYLLVSCGTAISTLSRENIKPHIHLELEFTASYLKQLPSEFYEEITFIAPLGFHKNTRVLFKSHRSFIINGHPLDELSPHLPADTIRIEHAFPTVTNLGVELLATLGASKVYIVGVDLAFSAQEHHAGGVMYDGVSAEDYQQESGEVIPVKNLTGKEVFTKREFLLSSQQIKAAIKRHSNTEFYSLSNGIDLGAKTLTHLPLEFSSFEPEISPTTETKINWNDLGYKCNPSHYFKAFLEKPTQQNQEVWRNEINKIIGFRNMSYSQAAQTKDVAGYWSVSLRTSIAGLSRKYEELNILNQFDISEEINSLMLQVLPLSAKI